MTKALDRAKKMLAVYDGGTHFNAHEVIGVLRELVDEITVDGSNVVRLPTRLSDAKEADKEPQKWWPS